MRSLKYYLLKFVLKKIIKKPIITIEALHKVRKAIDQVSFPKRPVDVEITSLDIQTIKAELYTPPLLETDTLLFYQHGGGFCMGSLESHRPYLTHLAKALGLRILTLNYALAPEHPFPKAIHQLRAAYDWLMTQPCASSGVIVGGESAGGGLTLSLLQSLRDQKKVLPKAALLFSPWVDLTLEGDSLQTNQDKDHYLHIDSVKAFASWYAQDTNPDDPLMSPVLGSLDGLPPLFIQYSDSELLASESMLLAHKAKEAGLKTFISELEDMPHAAIIFYPLIKESHQALQSAKEFLCDLNILPPTSS